MIEDSVSLGDFFGMQATFVARINHKRKHLLFTCIFTFTSILNQLSIDVNERKKRRQEQTFHFLLISNILMKKNQQFSQDPPSVLISCLLFD